MNMGTTEVMIGKTETGKATVATAFGETLPKAIEYTFSYVALENVEQVRQAEEFPTDEDIVEYVNNKRKANARQKALLDALEAAGYKKPSSAMSPWDKMVKLLTANGRTQSEAEQIATAAGMPRS